MRSARISRLAALYLALGALAGCGSARGADAGAADEPDPLGGQVITAEQIQKSQLSNGWQVVRRFARGFSFAENASGRPTRVTARGRESIHLAQEPLLMVDGVRVTDFRVLHQIAARDIETIVVMSRSEASTRYGPWAADGAIIVRTRS